jgi:hypothetical protein
MPLICLKTYFDIRKNIDKIDGSYIHTPAGKYYGGRYTDIPMYACGEKCIPAFCSYKKQLRKNSCIDFLLLSEESLIIPQGLIS